MLGTSAGGDDGEGGEGGAEGSDNGVLGTQASADGGAEVPTSVDAGGQGFTGFVTSPGGLGLLAAGLALLAAGILARRRTRA